jgi:glucokinase
MIKQFAIGIDLGGTIIKIGLVKDDSIIGEIAVEGSSIKGLEPSLPIMEAHINFLLQQAPGYVK